MPAVKVYTLLKILHLTGAKDKCIRFFLSLSSKNIKYRFVRGNIRLSYESGETIAELCLEQEGCPPLTIKLTKPGFRPFSVAARFNEILEGIMKSDMEIAGRIERR